VLDQALLTVNDDHTWTVLSRYAGPTDLAAPGAVDRTLPPLALSVLRSRQSHEAASWAALRRGFGDRRWVLAARDVRVLFYRGGLWLLFMCGVGEGECLMDLGAALRDSIVRVCGVDEDAVVPTATLEELGVDSLAAAEVITDMEIRTGVELPMDVLRGLAGLRTVGEVVDHLEAEIASPPGAGGP